MSTGDRLVSIYLKKFLPQQQMEENFQLLLRKFTEDLYSRIFPESGVFRGGVLSSSAPDTFDVSTPLEGSNSTGVDVVFDPSLGNQVPFENTIAIEYFVGLQQTTVPADVEINVRTGKIKYVFVEEAIGERADPDLVVDDGDGTMTVRVNSVTEINADNTGRTVKVFLKATEDGGGVGPQTLITPFEDLVVQYDGVNNFVETVTGLGQSATSISTSANDYEVVLIGPSVKKNTDIRLIDEVIFLGIITGTGAGNSPVVFDQTDRRVLVGGAGGGGFIPQIFTVLETDGTIRHSDSVVGNVSWSSDLFYRPFGTSGELKVLAANVTLADDEVAFLQIPDPFVAGTDVLQITPRSSVGLQSADRYWIFHRDGNLIKVRSGMQLEQGEERQLDDAVIGGVLNFGPDDKLRYDDSTNIFHFDADGGTDNANLAIGSEINFGDPTNNDKLAYSAGLLTVLLNNVITGAAVSTGRFSSQRAGATDTAFEALVTADAVSRFLVQADGKTEWSDGTAAADTDLFRGGVGILETTNIFKAVESLTQSGAVFTTPSSGVEVSGVDASLNEVYDRTKSRDLLKITANNAPDKAINIAAARLTLAGTEEVGLINSNTEIVDFAGATVDYGTGVVSVGDNFTAHTPSLSVRFFKYGLILNSDNEIEVIVPTADFASRAAADADTSEPLFDGGIPIGQTTVESISTTPGDIQAIIEEDTLFFGASGSGGGAINDFRVKKITGAIATIDKGEQKLMTGEMLIAGSGTTQASLPVEFTINLDTILGSGPAASTAYWLVIDKHAIESPFVLTDNDRPVIRINSESDFAILTTDPFNTNSFRYLPVARIFSASDSTWDGTGSSFGTTPTVRESFDGKFFSQVEDNSDTVTSADAANVFVHGLSGKPQNVQFYYNDTVTEVIVPDHDRLVDRTDTTITYTSIGLTFGGGETLRCEAIFVNKPGGNIGSLQTDKDFGPFTDALTLSVPHGLLNAQDIRGLVLIEHDVTAERFRILDNTQLVVDFNKTTIFFDWIGLAPSATLTYTLALGGSPLPASIPISIGGYTKFVGFGPGSFATVTEALAASVAGDSILVLRGYNITVQEDISLSDIRIRLMPGVKIIVTGIIATAAWLITGNRVDIQGLHMEVAVAGAQAAALRIQSDDCNINDTRISANDAGLTITDAINLTAASERNYVNAAVRTIAGTITNTSTDAGTNNGLDVRG